MLSIEETRKTLGDKAKDTSDEQIEETRNGIYQLVEIILDEYLREQGINTNDK